MVQPNTVTDTPLLPPREAPRITGLSRDSGCARSLNWRCDLPVDLDPEVVESVLVASGYGSRSQHPALKVFRHCEGHELAWVVTTGRVQIRVNSVVEPPAREEEAHRIHRDLSDLVRRSL